MCETEHNDPLHIKLLVGDLRLDSTRLESPLDSGMVAGVWGIWDMLRTGPKVISLLIA